MRKCFDTGMSVMTDPILNKLVNLEKVTSIIC